MKLNELIAILTKLNDDYGPHMLVAQGFCKPHSYRGNYADLAFKPQANVTLGEMLLTCLASLGKTFEGYKGGSFTMDGTVNVYIASWMCEGTAIRGVITRHEVKDGVVIHSIEIETTWDC